MITKVNFAHPNLFCVCLLVSLFVFNQIWRNPLEDRWVSGATGVETKTIDIPMNYSYKSSNDFGHKRFFLGAVEDCV